MAKESIYMLWPEDEALKPAPNNNQIYNRSRFCAAAYPITLVQYILDEESVIDTLAADNTRHTGNFNPTDRITESLHISQEPQPEEEPNT